MHMCTYPVPTIWLMIMKTTVTFPISLRWGPPAAFSSPECELSWEASRAPVTCGEPGVFSTREDLALNNGVLSDAEGASGDN
jgi:hypothetical protein